MENKLIIEKCKKEDLEKVIALSTECTMQIENGVVVKMGIANPVEPEDYQDLIVAKLNGEIVGSLIATYLDEDDKKWYGLRIDENPITIMKICTRGDLRGKGIAGAMIDYVKKQNIGKDIYVDIMASPAPNIKSRRAFERQGFTLEREAPYYYKEEKMNTSWWIYKFTAKTK